MKMLNVETTENGFIVIEGEPQMAGVRGKTWSFETAKSLSQFVKEWAEENINSPIKDNGSN